MREMKVRCLAISLREGGDWGEKLENDPRAVIAVIRERSDRKYEVVACPCLMAASCMAVGGVYPEDWRRFCMPGGWNTENRRIEWVELDDSAK